MAETTSVNCIYHISHEKQLERHDNEIKELDNRVTETEKCLAVYNVELTNAVKDIAMYMKDMNKTVNKIEQGTTQNSSDIQTLTNKIEQRDRDFEEMEKLKNRVEKIDSEGTINVRHDITQNYAKIKVIIYVGCTVGGAAITYLIGLLTGIIK